MPAINAHYEATGRILQRRIAALIPAHPEILDFEDAWALFEVPGFRCDDLAGLTVAMATAALEAAQLAAREERRARG